VDRKLMPTVLTLTAVAAMTVVLILLALVVVGMRQEPQTKELAAQPPSPIAALSRRLLRLSVRKPGPSLAREKQDRQ
jgi:hypothetical protein